MESQSESEEEVIPCPEMDLSLEELFSVTFGHSPTFVLINLMEQEVDVTAQHSSTTRRRSEDEFGDLEKRILLLGGTVRFQPEGNYEEQIPIIFVTNDDQFNTRAFRAWQEEEIRSHRKRDAFHEDFIMEIFHEKHMVDLRKYLIGYSIFEHYYGNDILSQGHNWTKLKLLIPIESDSSGDSGDPVYRKSGRRKPRAGKSAMNSARERSRSPIGNRRSQNRKSSPPSDAARNMLRVKIVRAVAPMLSTSSSGTSASGSRTAPDADMPSTGSSGTSASGSRTAPDADGDVPNRSRNAPNQLRVASPARFSPSPPRIPPVVPHRSPHRLGGAPPGAKLPPISFQEQKRILEYIIRHNAYIKIKSKSLYVEMEQRRVIGLGRTWQTLSNHVQRVLLRKEVIDEHRLGPIAMANFKDYIIRKNQERR